MVDDLLLKTAYLDILEEESKIFSPNMVDDLIYFSKLDIQTFQKAVRVNYINDKSLIKIDLAYPRAAFGIHITCLAYPRANF